MCIEEEGVRLRYPVGIDQVIGSRTFSPFWPPSYSDIGTELICRHLSHCYRNFIDSSPAIPEVGIG
jgi:hypothetical protein